MVSLIVLNYNSCELTTRCVESIHQQLSGKDYEIIVVDNGSCTFEREQLCQNLHGQECKIVFSKTNTGFGGGNMIGANEASGNYLCFLNSDIVLSEDCITPLCAYLEKHPEVGCITPQQYDIHGNPAQSFKHAPGIRHELLGDGIFEKFFPKQYPNRHRLYDTPIKVMQINGCMMVFPTDVFWRIGGFDTNIFLYYEEFDIAMRLKKQGLCCMLHPNYRFSHLHGASTSKIKLLPTRELYISKLYTYRKYHNFWISLIYVLLNIIIITFKPRKWYILPVLVRGESLSLSMKHLQAIYGESHN